MYRNEIFALLAVSALASASALAQEAPAGPPWEDQDQYLQMTREQREAAREAARERWEAMSQEERSAALEQRRQTAQQRREAAREQWQTMTPEQREAATAQRRQQLLFEPSDREYAPTQGDFPGHGDIASHRNPR